ncbi:serine/threonine protein kinase [Sphaerisporangium siamense]|uniref:non-specific serine/threonine protein kinase n=1 Tax=Sphaerisporangium siamense TaxID=795645 RepID=A0A7W7D807_9ACTN|nr:serine/threonine-protein kinase [Sphaerisporangium siamense]MBB4701701.1 serine/threonine-protein kinase [Sphaerisporangium siamense]
MGAWRVPGYTEIRDLGAGGSGRVVMARHEADGTTVAIKYLSGDLISDPGFLIRFRHEARLLELLDSPHAARFYEYVETDGGAAIVMELVNGVSLRAMLRSEGPTGAEAALVLLKGSLLGLGAAHANGLVHRDFKPENVVIDGAGHSKLVDFGIAVRVGDGVSGAGTPPYMAPEQWAGAPAGPSTDVYAATVVFFECLTGTRPFQSQNALVLARQHQTMPPPIEQVPASLRGLVERGMAKHPADRPASAAEFLAELEAVAVEAYGQDWEERGRRRLAALAGLLVLLFPLGEAAPQAGAALAESDLGARRGLKKLSVKIAIGALGLAVVSAVTAVLVGSLGDTSLQAQTSVLTPTPAPAETVTTDGSPEPAIDDSPTEVPSEEPTQEPSEEASAQPTTPRQTAAAPTGAPSPTAKAPSPSKKPDKPGPPASPTGKPKPKPSATEDEPQDPKVSTKPTPRPKPTPTPTPTSAPPSPQPTRTPTTPSPTPTPTRSGGDGEGTGETPSDGGETPRGGESGEGTEPTGPADPPPGRGDDVPAGLLAVGLVTTGAVPATLFVRKRMAGRHRRRR